MGRWMAVVLCVWSLATLSRAASYSFTTIDQPGATDTYLYGINDVGGIVGGFPGFQYESGAFTEIPAPRPSDINNAGQIVGEYRGTNGNAAFLYSGGVFTSLPGSSASGINDAGQIVGFTQIIGNPGETHGYLYSNGTLTPIDFPGAGMTVPSSINNVGQIAGTFRYPGATGYIHGFVESNGVFTIVDEPGFVDAYLNGTQINGINDSEDIVGWIVKGSGGCSFIYHEGSFTCFSVPGALFTYAYGINNAGQIVGDYGFSVSAAHGFIATPIPEPAVPEPGALLLVAVGLIALATLVARGGLRTHNDGVMGALLCRRSI